MIKKLKDTEIKKLYKEYMKADFHLESPPYEEYVRLAEQNCLEVLVFVQNGVEKGYAVCMEKENYLVLLFFAAYKGLRGQGIGTRFIQELKEHYAGKELVVEVETLDNSEEDGEQDIIRRRIVFYENLGFRKLPNVQELLNGFVYHIMTLPAYNQDGQKGKEVVKMIESIYSNSLAGFVKNFEINYVRSN